MSRDQNLGIDKDITKLLRGAFRQGCTMRSGSHNFILFGPDGRKICSVPSSRGRVGHQRQRIVSRLRRVGIEVKP